MENITKLLPLLLLLLPLVAILVPILIFGGGTVLSFLFLTPIGQIILAIIGLVIGITVLVLLFGSSAGFAIGIVALAVIPLFILLIVLIVKKNKAKKNVENMNVPRRYRRRGRDE